MVWLVGKGLRNLGNDIELKSLQERSSKDTADGYIKNTLKKRDAVRVVFDNSRNTGMPDDELIGYLRRLSAFKRGVAYVIGGLLVMVSPFPASWPIGQAMVCNACKRADSRARFDKFVRVVEDVRF